MSKLKDLTGQRFGKLTVIDRSENDNWGKSRWLCACDCGGRKVVNSRELNRGDTTSCGCNYFESNCANNLVGQRFGLLTVLRRGETQRTAVVWECVCDCGNQLSVLAGSLRQGLTKSCGCLRKKIAAERATRHGCSSEKLYPVWSQMRQRCSNTNNANYKHYGGRGITVYPEWNDYPTFREWAFASGYAEGLTIDRIDVDGAYTPDNCRWIPLKDQMLNRRSSLSYRANTR